MPGLIIIAATALLWVFVIRAVKQRQVGAHHAFIASLGPGDRVTTAGGIFGTIREIDREVCRLEIAPGVVIDLVPIVINRRVQAAGAEPAPAPDVERAPASAPDAVDIRLDKD